MSYRGIRQCKPIDPQIVPTIFIQEIEKRPELWESDSSPSPDRTLELWIEVGKVIYADWETFDEGEVQDRVRNMQKKWKCLRDTYRREIRFRAIGREKKRVYKHFKRLQFLGGFSDLPNYESEEETSYFEDQELAFSDTTPKVKQESDLDIDEHYVATPPKKMKKSKPKRKDYQIEEQKFMNVEDPVYLEDYSGNENESFDSGIPKKFKIESPSEEDCDKLFLLSFVAEMKKLPANLKMWARSKISQVMHEAVMCNFRNSEPEDFINFSVAKK